MRASRLALVLGLALALGAAAGAAGAHPDPSGDPADQLCALLAAPIELNNVEMSGAALARASDGAWWTFEEGGSTYQTDMDLTAARVAGTAGPASVTISGHPAQVPNQGRYGLYYSATDPVSAHAEPTTATSPHGLPAWKGDHFNWRAAAACANREGAVVAAQGTGIGYCTRSVGLGTATIGATQGAAHTAIVRWESAGHAFLLTDPSARGLLGAQSDPPAPTSPCLDGRATTLIVDGPLHHE